MPARLLHRSATQRKIAGVCGGIAQHADLDPTLLRLGAVALAILAPPLGLLGYVAAWIVIPLERGADAPAQGASAPGGAARTSTASVETRAGLAGGLAIVGAGAFLLLINLGVLDWQMLRIMRWRTLWPLALIALGGILVAHSLRTLRSAQRRPGSL